MFRLLVIANRTCPCPALLNLVVERTRLEPDHKVEVVAPALNSRLRHMLSDVDEAVQAAAGRLDQAVTHLRQAGVNAVGQVGDSDPMLAIEDALALFPADEVIISTLPQGHSNWLERGLIERARAVLDMPVHHEVSRYGISAAV